MKKFIVSLVLCILPLLAFAQEAKTPEQKEKEFFEAIDQQIERLTDQLKLEDWQVFYVDSILVHDYTALQEDYKAMGQSRISNTDLYQEVQDKWMEQIYCSFNKIFNEEQWAKYLKSGAARDKKARDKRAEKRSK